MIKILRRSNGGGGKVSAPPSAPAAAAAPAPVVEDTGPDPAMQAELEKQRAQRYQAGKTGSNSETTGQGTAMAEEKPKSTILGA